MGLPTNGEKLTHLIEKQGWTQYALATEIAGKRRKTIKTESVEREMRRWEAGKHMGATYRKLVAHILKVDPQKLSMPVSQRKKEQRKYITEFITRPDKDTREENLFYQSIPVYEAHFPEDERDAIDDIKEWIVESRIAEEKNEPDGDPWKDLYAVLHNHEEVIGMAYLTAHRNFPWVFGGYWCINSFDVGDNLDNEFLNAIEAHLKNVVRGLKGIVFEIVWIDVDYLKDVIAQGEPFSVNDRLLANLEAVERLRLFQRGEQALPVVSNGYPFPYVQPALEPPFDYEKPMILMVRKQKNIRWEDIELDELLWYHVVEKRDGTLVAFSTTQYLELKPLQGMHASPHESFLAVWFIITNLAFRRRGLAHTLYERFLREACAEAQARGQRLKAIIGEAVSSMELFLNPMGRKRIYFEDKRRDMHEVRYLAPPINMDSCTGEPDGVSMPEHLMLQMLSGTQELPVEELLKMIWVMYEQYVGEESNYQSRGAFERARQYNWHLLQQLSHTLSKAKDGRVFLLSQAEREQRRAELRALGKELYEIEES